MNENTVIWRDEYTIGDVREILDSLGYNNMTDDELDRFVSGWFSPQDSVNDAIADHIERMAEEFTKSEKRRQEQASCATDGGPRP